MGIKIKTSTMSIQEVFVRKKGKNDAKRVQNEHAAERVE